MEFIKGKWYSHRLWGGDCLKFNYKDNLGNIWFDECIEDYRHCKRTDWGVRGGAAPFVIMY